MKLPLKDPASPRSFVPILSAVTTITMQDTLADPSLSSLPIDCTEGLKLSVVQAGQYGAALHERYASAQPFPHIVIDHFLPQPLLQKVVRHFPARRVEEEQLFELGHVGHHKRQVPPMNCDGFCRELFGFFNSAPVLKFLENLSGIRGLLPDPYFSGGGFHEIARGGKLGIHADFRLNKALNLHRRLNMLIYLNEGWQDEWGGQLELWDRAMQHKVVGISPILNRCAIFNTDAESYHGHPDPLSCPERVTRKSIALYYYTASAAILSEVPDNPTVYVNRPVEQAPAGAKQSRFVVDRLVSELMPPVLQRALFRARARVRNRRNGL